MRKRFRKELERLRKAKKKKKEKCSGAKKEGRSIEFLGKKEAWEQSYEKRLRKEKKMSRSQK